jgi:hypothetical protein
VRPYDEDQALRWWMKIAEIAGDTDKVNYELIKNYKKKKNYKRVQELALKYVKSKPLKFSEGNYHHYYYSLKLLISSYMEDRRGAPRDFDEAL